MGSTVKTYAVQKRILRSREIVVADTDTTARILDIPVGFYATAAWIYIGTLFAGGTPSIDVGDEDDPNGWITTAEITEATAGPYRGGAAALAVSGKYYASGGQIEAVVAIGLTAGSAYVFLEGFDAADLME